MGHNWSLWMRPVQTAAAAQPSDIKASICNRSSSFTRFFSSLTLSALSTITNETFILYSHDFCFSTVTTTATTAAHPNAGTHHSFPVFTEPSFSSARNFSHALTPPQSLNYESHEHRWVLLGAPGNFSKTCVDVLCGCPTSHPLMVLHTLNLYLRISRSGLREHFKKTCLREERHFLWSPCSSWVQKKKMKAFSIKDLPCLSSLYRNVSVIFRYMTLLLNVHGKG